MVRCVEKDNIPIFLLFAIEMAVLSVLLAKKRLWSFRD